MKLVEIFDVTDNYRFLVGLLDEKWNGKALEAAIIERGKVSQIEAYSQIEPFRRAPLHLAFQNRELSSGTLPDILAYDDENTVHIIPSNVDPSAKYEIIIEVQTINIDAYKTRSKRMVKRE